MRQPRCTKHTQNGSRENHSKSLRRAVNVRIAAQVILKCILLRLIMGLNHAGRFVGTVIRDLIKYMRVQFNDREKFEFALFLMNKKFRQNLDIGYADMIISFFNDETAAAVISIWTSQQIWIIPPIEGLTGYKILND